MLTMVTWTLLLVMVTGTLATPMCDSPEVEECFRKTMGHPVDPIQARDGCVKQWWNRQRPDNNMTHDDILFFKSRVQSRYGYGPPPTGHRIRKDIRRYTDEERERLFAAFRVLYRNGIMARFGRLHATAVKTIHRGPSFLPWHRVFIADFEEELRRIDPTLSIPYWDSTMDVIMERPTDSVVWTPCFFGQNKGTLKTPPFKDFFGGRNVPLQRGNPTRDCGGPLLPSKAHIRNLMNNCHYREITSGKGIKKLLSNLEHLHDGPHDWVGGDVGMISVSAFDPVFYFHHAFVDFIWDEFQKHQVKDCNVNPEYDYSPNHESVPNEPGKPRIGHHFCDLMVGYEHLRNADGLWLKWARDYYSYEPLPRCPNCGSPYLYCDPRTRLCKSKTKLECKKGIIPQKAAKGAMMGDLSDPMFEGEELSEFHPFIMDDPFDGPKGDRRHSGMSFEESRKVLLEQTDVGQNYSATLPTGTAAHHKPPVIGSFGAHSVKMHPGTGHAAIGFGGFGDSFAPRMPYRRIHFYPGYPMHPGFMPFRRAGPSYGLPSPPRPYMNNKGGYPMDPAQCPATKGSHSDTGHGSIMSGFKPMHKQIMKTFGWDFFFNHGWF